MKSLELILAISSACVAVANVISAIYVVKFIREGIPMLDAISRSLAILRADVLIKRRQAAREKFGGPSQWETEEERAARIAKEDADLTPTPEEISKHS